MRKRMLAALLALVMAASLLVMPAGAAETTQFSDVSDKSTATAIETLRLMGVLDGYGNGTFRPEGKLTRAQFCKMVTYVMNASNELGMYRTVTVFPDVKPSHWAAAYINLAAKGKAVIAGYPDGSFCPDRTVTVGQAVTILVRLLGYKDDEVGGVWPDSYMAVGAIAGLTDGVSTDGHAALTRGQAAKLFLNLLTAEKKDGGTLYTLSKETELVSLDGGTGQLKTLDGGSYTMVNPVSSTSLLGRRGQVVLVGDRALTFLPSSAGSGGLSDAAVIVYTDRSAAGFEALAGNSDYQIYKNGSPAGKGDLRRNDVATYYAATNSILVCDTRVSVYYESCEPSPSEPTKLQVLGGTELYVLPTARDSLARFKPGDQMTLLLTIDGQVAGAVEASGSSARSNAVGVVDADGKVLLLCGTTTIPLSMTAEEKYQGQVVRLSAGTKDKVNLSVVSSTVRGDLDVEARTLGGKKLAENVTVFRDGTLTSLSQLSSGLIREGQFQYVRTNWAGEIDLIVIRSELDVQFGRVFWESESETVLVPDSSGKEPGAEGYVPTTSVKTTDLLGVEYGNGKRTKTFAMNYNVRTGDFVAFRINQGGTGFSLMEKLTELKNVSAKSWIGKTAVTFGGRTYEVPSDVLCYNMDSREWVTLDQALAYSDTADLHVKNGVVRVVEVRHTA